MDLVHRPLLLCFALIAGAVSPGAAAQTSERPATPCRVIAPGTGTVPLPTRGEGVLLSPPPSPSERRCTSPLAERVAPWHEALDLRQDAGLLAGGVSAPVSPIGAGAIGAVVGAVAAFGYLLVDCRFIACDGDRAYDLLLLGTVAGAVAGYFVVVSAHDGS